MGKNIDVGGFIKGLKGKKEQWLILLLVGILLLVIAMPATEKEGEEKGNTADTASEGSSGENADASYVRRMERKLEEALSQMEGVGKVSVMITLSSSAEKVVEKDREIASESSTGGSDGQSSKSTTSSETSVYSGAGGEEAPYVTREISPRTSGVLVIAEGGDNAVVVKNITEAVQALFGVDTHKIKVMKRN